MKISFWEALGMIAIVLAFVGMLGLGISALDDAFHDEFLVLKFLHTQAQRVLVGGFCMVVCASALAFFVSRMSGAKP